MKQIHFATTNAAKVKGVSAVLLPRGIEVIQAELSIEESRSDDIKLIAGEKAIAAYKILKQPVIAQDAGFYVHSYNGFPRALVNFMLETIGVDGLLKLVQDRPRECHFEHYLAYYDGKTKEPNFFHSRLEGVLAREPRGREADYLWSDLCFVFIPFGEDKTLAEMTIEEYQEWRESRMKYSFTIQFVEWYLEQP